MCYQKDTRILIGLSILAITTQHPFTDYYFVDMRASNITALQERSRAFNVPEDRIRCLIGDANQRVDDVVREITRLDSEFIRDAWPCLNLAFLDPEGLELEWETIELLARMNRMDLIIHYSQNGISRNAGKCYLSEKETVVDRYFGGDGWKEVYGEARRKKGSVGIHRALIDYYKSNLLALGYAEVKDDEEIWTEPLIRNRRNAPLYRLLFASKHPLGMKFWKDVTKVDVYGQSKLL